MASANLGVVKWHIENNELLAHDFSDAQGRPLVYPDPEEQTWRADAMVVNRHGTYKDPTWQAKGLDSKGIHGRRLDWLLGDDVVTPAQRLLARLPAHRAQPLGHPDHHPPGRRGQGAGLRQLQPLPRSGLDPGGAAELRGLPPTRSAHAGRSRTCRTPAACRSGRRTGRASASTPSFGTSRSASGASTCSIREPRAASGSTTPGWRRSHRTRLRWRSGPASTSASTALPVARPRTSTSST